MVWRIEGHCVKNMYAECTRVERLNSVLPKSSILLIPLQVELNLWNKHENEKGKTN